MANATTGVNLLCLTSGMSLDMTAEGKLPFLLSKINEFHPYSLGRFRLNAIYVELYDELTYTWGDTFGYNALADFVNHPTYPGGEHPRLYGITALEARAEVGSGASMIFHYAPPRFNLSPVEQEFLLWALAGDTDAYLGESLCIAAVTVRKRWDGIYSRVAESVPDFFGVVSDVSGKRGMEKKRRLLSYLTHHMEELRPYRHQVTPVPSHKD